MISGADVPPGGFPAWVRTALSAWLVAGLSIAATPSVQAGAQDWGLPQLMQEMAQVRSESGRFTERTTMHMLNAPLLTTGTLHYVAPDHLQKITLSPQQQTFILDGRQVTISGGPQHQTQHFSLGDASGIEGLVEGIRATLAGDLDTLNTFYTVTLSGGNAQWQLMLQPRSSGPAQFVRSMRIEGSGNRIEAIDTNSGNGDHSEMHIVEDSINAR